MRTFLLLFLFSCHISYSQNEILGKVELTYAPDLLVTKTGFEMEVIVLSKDNLKTHFYMANDETKMPRSLANAAIETFIDNSKDRSFAVVGIEDLKGKKVYLEIIPFQPAFSKYVQIRIDMGVNEYQGIWKQDGTPIRFKSEFSAVNYFISQGWELYSIETTEKGSLGLGAFSSGLAGGTSVKVSSTRYIFTKTL